MKTLVHQRSLRVNYSTELTASLRFQIRTGKNKAAKSEGGLTSLSWLDTARGITSLVQKLPYNLQEKWMALGYTLKKQHIYPR